VDFLKSPLGDLGANKKSGACKTLSFVYDKIDTFTPFNFL
jgi:hypothetical protein